MRLFTALWPPREVVEALAAAVDAHPPWHPDGAWRPVDPGSWHLTLCFHGEDDAATRARELDRAFAGATAPRLRLAGTGTFPGVVWAGVAPPGALADLAVRAGADPSAFRAHLTLARRSRRDRDRPELAPGRPADRRSAPVEGRYWTPTEVLLVGSEPGGRYTPVHRVPLG
ncbi:2'-5' RNA ligase family protein [Pseudonocardia sp. HH130630-07]|uniref:2'-5' RNA ligase family protein n=1 Tax=Pseudonocardia sp. HH130630-07 TaxID=1690815 RepID=UPI000814B79C|nr:2'-5' RNA ligase family protein [Pseudonocardia sp. HH130630-07]ANY08380.1 hypothetical protein AFB00_21210 [Pseudonocardia sp. HH130630-07]